ncbi:hypothetical protein V6B33_06070 [Mangrovibacillus sp. Mu-81]|jgi:hypothetical protein|uniref:hypothetical protein n=1 Tax=Mangrovibacillus sp. Mu-81 TaxID=3121478 RepID=UPI002FE47E2D
MKKLLSTLLVAAMILIFNGVNSEKIENEKSASLSNEQQMLAIDELPDPWGHGKVAPIFDKIKDSLIG